jgi:hypothetical protein
MLGLDVYELLMDEIKADSCDYKKKKLIAILKESDSYQIDIYSTLLNAFYKKHRKRKRETA